jgi:hypothetical protein
MRTRSVIAAVAVLAVTAAPVANAAAKPKPKPKPKPLCSLIKDDTGDVHWLLPGVSSPALDIVSGDVATGPKTMVAVLRLAGTDLSTAKDPTAAAGYSWFIATTSSLGHSYAFTVSYSSTGGLNPGATVDGQAVAGTAVAFKVVGSTFQWTLQRKVSPDLSRPKIVFKQFRSRSEMFSTNADAADSATSSYPDKALSCVHAT